MMQPPPSPGSPQAQAHNPLANKASKHELSTIQSLDGWTNKALPVIMRVASIAGLVGAGFFGIVGTLIAGAALVGAEVARAHLHNKADLNRELALYHKDIARVLGKPADATLTIQDMRDAADEKKVGDKALKPLKDELDHLKYRSKYNYAMGAIRAVLTTAITSVLSAMLGDYKQASVDKMIKSSMQIFYTVSFSTMASGAAHAAAENIGSKKFEKNKPVSIYTDLVKLQEFSQHQNVNAEQVFNIVVKKDKELAADIEQKFGTSFDCMTVRQKQRVVHQYEDKVHAKLLAEHINEGVGVTAIPLSIAGQLDWNALPPLPEKEDKGEGKSSPVVKQITEKGKKANPLEKYLDGSYKAQAVNTLQ